jgi:hypothetical protein
MIDYAYPMMMVEKHLKKAHDALLSQDWDTGKEELIQAIAEARLAYNAVVHMQQEQDGK